MNLLTDLRSELALAVLLEKKYTEKLGSNDALNLIGKVYDILEPISVVNENQLDFPTVKDEKAVCH